MRTVPLALIATTAFAVLAGCSSTPVAPPPAPQAATAPQPARPSPAPAPVSPSVPQPVAASTVKTVNVPPYLDPKSALSTDRSVYFDFDESRIKTEYASLIVRHGNYLGTHPALSIKVEGNCDERGGSEYNLALGQKRAQAVVRALMIYGVKEAQMEAISWGEERPRASGHDEAAWAQNRRADLVYPTK